MDIQNQLKKFKLKLNSYRLSEEEKEYYVDIERRILESKQLPVSQLIARAKRIKPLVRIERDNEAEYHSKYHSISDTDTLCFCTPCDIRQRSYLYDFTPQKIVRSKDKPLPVPSRTKIGEFTCYHDTGSFYSCLMPSVDEVLQQIPIKYDWLEIDAFELIFTSDNFSEVYDSILDCHVSTAVLYRFDKRLPARMREQTVIFDGTSY
ncbi:MAG: hypothetical protein IJS88_00260 [Alphaproteobacteria bacterium]|nr:hypothetical protein [Alphaproteobacteria bacterium]